MSIGIMRHVLAVAVALAAFLPMTSVTTLNAASGERTLYLHYTHTNETKRITFRRNGRYDQAGLNDLNTFLRDWRRGESTRMDPALFDLLWNVYQEVGASKPIHVVSAYRSPQTNEMLRSRSSAVAKNSRHTMGMAMDFFIPGIAISKLRETAMRYQVGGVGYYPTSGSPFVHLDTGNVRAWPRMTRTQLSRLFPNGRTLHLPSDGVVLSASGRQYAANEWAKCHSVPCVGSNPNTAPSRSEGNSGSGRNLLDLFFGNGDDQTVTTTVVASTSPTPRTVTTVAVAPIPAARADFLNYRTPTAAPVPMEMSQTLFVATRTTSIALPDASPIASELDRVTVASISADTLGQDARPAARVLLSPTPVVSSALAAYVPVVEPEPDAQRALQLLIERRNANNQISPGIAETAPPPALRGSIITASLGSLPAAISAPTPASNTPQNDFSGLFDGTFLAVENAQAASGSANTNIALAILNTPQAVPDLPINMREVVLFAPEVDHMTNILIMPSQVANDRTAILSQPVEMDFSPATELGPKSAQIVFSLAANPLLQSNRFTHSAPAITTDI